VEGQHGWRHYFHQSDGWCLQWRHCFWLDQHILTIANVALGDTGWQFMNTATNSAGGTNSASATLTVNAIPSLSGNYSTSVLALQPVAYWPLNETSDPSAGGVGVYDASGNARRLRTPPDLRAIARSWRGIGPKTSSFHSTLRSASG